VILLQYDGVAFRCQNSISNYLIRLKLNLVLHRHLNNKQQLLFYVKPEQMKWVKINNKMANTNQTENPSWTAHMAICNTRPRNSGVVSNHRNTVQKVKGERWTALCVHTVQVCSLGFCNPKYTSRAYNTKIMSLKDSYITQHTAKLVSPHIP